MSAAQGFKLLMEKGPTPGQEFDFSQSTITFGRDASAIVNFPISSATVSRLHARIRLKDGVWTIEDLGSSNGTFINGSRLGDKTETLNTGDYIQLGSTIKLIVQIPEPSARENPVAATVLGEEFDFPTQTKPPQLIVTVAGNEPETHLLAKSKVRLGRSPDNDIVIASKIVSRHHAQIEQVYGGFQLVVDDQASYPIFYKGRPNHFAGRPSFWSPQRHIAAAHRTGSTSFRIARRSDA